MDVVVLLAGVSWIVLGILAWRGLGKSIASPFHPGGAGALVIFGLLAALAGGIEVLRHLLDQPEDWWLVEATRPLGIVLIFVGGAYILLNLIGLCPDRLRPPHQRKRRPEAFGSRRE